MNKDAFNAINTAALYGGSVTRYTETEGGEWVVKPIFTAPHVHVILFSNGLRWDNVTGWGKA